jgi:FkbM family methyltransferase
VHPPKNKFFVDVGAFDGITYSNTHLLYRRGWTGIGIEPCTKNFLKFQARYRDTGVIAEQIAVSDYEGVTDLYVATIPNNEDWGSDVSSLDKRQIDRWPAYRWEKEQVRVTTLNSILPRHNIKEVDFLTIDTEGEDLRVLKGLDLNVYKPALILVEYVGGKIRTEILQLTQRYGYRLWIDNGQDLFLVRASRFTVLRLKLMNLLLDSLPTVLKKVGKCVCC